MDEHQLAREYIEAFFDDLDSKIAFLSTLTESGHGDEARMLCTAYLDGLTNWLSASSGSQRNFSDVLSAHGGEPVLALVLPGYLIESLPWKSAPQGAKDLLRSALVSLPPHEAINPATLTTQLGTLVPPSHLSWLQHELWRGTVASAVYTRIRSLNTHWLGSPQVLTFSATRWNGAPLPTIDFDMLYVVLQTLAAYARELSLRTNKWFGHLK